jgi:hypothetical protein
MKKIWSVGENMILTRVWQMFWDYFTLYYIPFWAGLAWISLVKELNFNPNPDEGESRSETHCLNVFIIIDRKKLCWKIKSFANFNEDSGGKLAWDPYKNTEWRITEFWVIMIVCFGKKIKWAILAKRFGTVLPATVVVCWTHPVLNLAMAGVLTYEDFVMPTVMPFDVPTL